MRKEPESTSQMKQLDNHSNAGKAKRRKNANAFIQFSSCCCGGVLQTNYLLPISCGPCELLCFTWISNPQVHSPHIC